MAEQEKSRWDALRDWTAGLLLPLAIFVYTYKKDQSDDKSRELDRISTMIKSLGSTSSKERDLARSWIELLYPEGNAPAVVKRLLQVNVVFAPTKDESNATNTTLARVSRASDAQSQPMTRLPVRAYLQIDPQTDRITGDNVRRVLESNGVNIPGIEVQPGPSTSVVKYFHTEDLPKAQEIVNQLRNLAIPANLQDTSAYAKARNVAVPLGQLEIWLAPGATVNTPVVRKSPLRQ